MIFAPSLYHSDLQQQFILLRNKILPFPFFFAKLRWFICLTRLLSTPTWNKVCPLRFVVLTFLGPSPNPLSVSESWLSWALTKTRLITLNLVESRRFKPTPPWFVHLAWITSAKFNWSASNAVKTLKIRCFLFFHQTSQSFNSSLSLMKSEIFMSGLYRFRGFQSLKDRLQDL